MASRNELSAHGASRTEAARSSRPDASCDDACLSRQAAVGRSSFGWAGRARAGSIRSSVDGGLHSVDLPFRTVPRRVGLVPEETAAWPPSALARAGRPGAKAAVLVQRTARETSH